MRLCWEDQRDIQITNITYLDDTEADIERIVCWISVVCSSYKHRDYSTKASLSNYQENFNSCIRWKDLTSLQLKVSRRLQKQNKPSSVHSMLKFLCF